MLATAPFNLLNLVRNRRPGFSLEAPFYVNREIFDLDLEVIFGRHWIFVGVEPDVPEPGDFIKVDVGRNSVVIVRDDDQNIRAFHNVCRHRGARLVNDEKGLVGNLVCPYHQWTYDLSGALIHAEHMDATFDPRCYGLKPVHLRNLAGLLFVCFAERPPEDFDDMAQLVEPYLAPHRLGESKVACQIDLVEDGNWKLTMENNRECYHCGGHPELLRALFPFFGYREGDVVESERPLYERFKRSLAVHVENWIAAGLPFEAIEELDGRPTGFRTERLALDNNAHSYTMSGKVASKRLMGGFRHPALGALHLHTQPNSWHHFLSDHAVTFCVLPLSADKTLVRTKWLVHKDAVEGVDYDPDVLTQVWRATNEQDGTFVGYAQCGVQSPAYEPGPYSGPEYQVEKFSNWYIERLAEHLALGDGAAW